MKAVLIISSLIITFTLGDVVTNTYGTYLQTPEAISKMSRSDSGYSYSVTSARSHPSSFLYGVQQIRAPMAFAYSSLGANPLSFNAQNILPYDYSNKNFLPKIVIPYSTLAFSPLISQMSTIYQTSSIPSLLQSDQKIETAEKPAPLGQQAMMDQQPMLPQNLFMAPFLGMNDGTNQQNLISSNDASAPVEVNKAEDDSVAVESA